MVPVNNKPRSRHVRVEKARQGFLHGRQGNQHANGQHRPGEGVAQGRKAHRHPRRRAAAHARAVGEAKRQHGGDEGGGAGNAETRGHEVAEPAPPKGIAFR